MIGLRHHCGLLTQTCDIHVKALSGMLAIMDAHKQQLVSIHIRVFTGKTVQNMASPCDYLDNRETAKMSSHTFQRLYVSCLQVKN